MEFDSTTEPNLIGPRIKKTINKIIKKKSNSNTISDKISNMVTNFYKEYISDHKILVFIFVVSFIILLNRYYSKKNRKNDNVKTNKEAFSEEEQKIFNEIMNIQPSNLRYDTQPTFNVLESVNKQHEPVNYLPDHIPLNMPNKDIVYSKPFENLNNPNYDYNNVYTNPSLSYYSGTHDTYKNAQDTDIINPLGWATDFNSSTGNYVNQMTTANKQNLIDYQTLIDNMQAELSGSLKYGPDYLNPDNLEPEIEAPYADDV